MRVRLLITVILLITFSFTISGCSRKSSFIEIPIQFGKNKSVPPATLNLYLQYGFTPPYMDEIVKEIEKRTSSSLNIRLKINFINMFDYDETIQKLLYSRDKIDAYVYSVTRLNRIIRKNELGLHMDITSLFPRYAPEIYDRLTREELAEAEYEGKLYAVPSKKNVVERMYVLVREDIMKKYGLDEIRTLEDYEAYLEKAAKEGLSCAIMPTDFIINAYLESRGCVEYGNCGLYYNRHDPEIRLTPMEELDEYLAAVEIARRWAQKGYIEPVYKSNAAYSVDNSFNSAMAQFDTISSVMVNSSLPVRYYALYPDAYTSKTSDVRNEAMFFSSASMVVPKALMLLNWIGSSQENYDLVMYGLKGKDYIIEKGKVKMLPNNSQWYYSIISHTGMDRLIECVDMNRPVGQQPANFWKTYNTELNRMCIENPLAGFRYAETDENLFALLRERKSRLAELNQSILADDYMAKFEEFKTRQKQAGINNTVNQLDIRIKEWLDRKQ